MSDSIGFTAIIFGILCFSLCFLPVKRYNIGHSMYYQFVMCVGIWTVSLIVSLIRKSSFAPFAMIGGVIWAIGNMTVCMISKYIGLSMGMLIWGITSMIIGWSIGYFGLVGIARQIVSMPSLNIASICVIIISIIIMFGVKPNVHEDNNTLTHRIVGYILAIVAGILYGFNIAPSKYLSEQNDVPLIDYIFSHSTGILAASTIFYL
jgi:uncharacterized membrane protein YdcZ (DUF606 family)